MINQNQQALEYYRTGNLKNSFVNSIPVNPISLKYELSEKGKNQKYIDEQNNINRLVRTHHLQTCGTSGYNIINGRNTNLTD